MANLMPLNLTLSLTVHFCAVHGYAATYMHITHVILLFHSISTMQSPHVFHKLPDQGQEQNNEEQPGDQIHVRARDKALRNNQEIRYVLGTPFRISNLSIMDSTIKTVRMMVLRQ